MQKKEDEKKLIDTFQMKMQHLKTTHHNSIFEHNLYWLVMKKLKQITICKHFT
jgi:hypothetical protein